MIVIAVGFFLIAGLLIVVVGPRYSLHRNNDAPTADGTTAPPVTGVAVGTGTPTGTAAPTDSVALATPPPVGAPATPPPPSTGAPATAATLRSMSAEIELIFKPGDAGYAALRTAYLTNGQVCLALLTGALSAAESEGPVGNFAVTAFNRTEELEEGVVYTATLKLTKLIEWIDATAGSGSARRHFSCWWSGSA